MRFPLKYLLLALLPVSGLAQIPNPQIPLTGNIGCSGFPCLNNGTLIMASDANRTMTAVETSALYIKVTSSVSLTATRNLIAPSGRFQFTIENATTGGQAIQIIGPSGLGVTIPNGITVAVWNDGTNYIQIGSVSSGNVQTSPSGNQTVTQPYGTALSVNNLTATGNLNGIINPSSYGVPSASTTTTTGTISASSNALTLTSPTSFTVGMGVMVEHGGPACGSVRGASCPTGQTPVVSNVGTSGATTYNYRVSCIDGLGGVGITGATGTTTTGNASLTATNYNQLTITGVSGCIEVAVYRGGSLIGTQFAKGSGSYTFNDTGQTALGSHRDLPLAPTASAIADNLVGIIQTLVGSVATLNVTATTAVSAGTVYHSDTPLVQAAINSGASSTITGDSNYHITYPLNGTGKVGVWSVFLLCDTGDICLDVTGQQGILLNNTSLNAFGTLVQPSTVGLYCARDSGVGTSQNLNTTNLYVNVGGGTNVSGPVAFYNYACEIENHIAPNLNSQHLIVLTAGNIFNVQSPFDGAELTGNQSMSQITVSQMGGGALGYAMLLENVYTLNVFGGYFNGGNSTTYPWSIGIQGQSGHINFEGFRTEGRGGFMTMLGSGSTLIESKIWVDAYRSNSTTPQIELGTAGVLSQSNVLVDDFGGSSTTVDIVHGTTGGCVVVGSSIFQGIHQVVDTSACSGGGMLNNQIADQNTYSFISNNQNVITTSTNGNGLQIQGQTGTNGQAAQWFIPNSNGTPSSPSSIFGNGYVWQVGATVCNSGPTWGLENLAHGCPLDLSYNSATEVLSVGQNGGGVVTATTYNKLGTTDGCATFSSNALTSTGSPCGSSSGTVTHTAGALTSGQVVIGNAAADIKVDTGCSTDGAGNQTCVSFNGSSTTIPGYVSLVYHTGANIPALASNSSGWVAPNSGGTSYLFKLPATITAGILHAAAPATGDGVNESALTSSPVDLTADVTGVLPVANGGSPAISNIVIPMPTSAIGANSCTSPTATTMTGVAIGSAFAFAFATNPNAVVGWGANGGLTWTSWPTANTVNWSVCNQTTSSITPGAISLNVGAR